MAKQPKRKVYRTGLEEDIHTNWRKVLILQPSLVKFVKKMTNRKERQAGKKEAHDEW